MPINRIPMTIDNYFDYMQGHPFVCTKQELVDAFAKYPDCEKIVTVGKRRNNLLEVIWIQRP